jgi:hypothetical protein
MEGIPYATSSAKSFGFRRPEYVISFDPSLFYSHALYTFSVNGRRRSSAIVRAAYPMSLGRARRGSVLQQR